MTDGGRRAYLDGPAIAPQDAKATQTPWREWLLVSDLPLSLGGKQPVGWQPAGLSDEDIEIASDWPGDAGLFVRTLLEVGFLEGETTGYRVHDWAEHNPWAASRGQRVELAKAAAAARWNGAQGMRSACDPHAERMRNTEIRNAHHPTQPHPTQNLKTSSSEVETTSDQTDTQPLSLVGSGMTDTTERKAAPKRGTRLPEGFAVTDAHRAFARQNGLPNPDEQLPAFCDYWLAQSGQKGVKADWDATFRTWLRNAPKYQGRRPPRMTPINTQPVDYTAGAQKQENGAYRL